MQAERLAIVSAADAAADALLVPIAAELRDIVKQLKPWWAASIDELTGGKRKSIELGGCVLGYRLNPPKVVHDADTDESAIGLLLSAELDDLVRSKPSLDKAAILKLLEAERQAQLAPETPASDADVAAEPTPGARLEALGFAIEQKEVFFVDVAAAIATGTVIVDDAQSGAVA